MVVGSRPPQNYFTRQGKLRPRCKLEPPKVGVTLDDLQKLPHHAGVDLLARRRPPGDGLNKKVVEPAAGKGPGISEIIRDGKHPVGERIPLQK